MRHLGVFAAKVIREFPHICGRLPARVVEVVRAIAPGDFPLFPVDSFGPNDPDALRYPFDQSTIQFVSTDEQLSLIDFESSDILGFDCEWRASVIKFPRFPVSIFQIATRERVYILDLIALSGSSMLNSKLSAMFLNTNVTKLGLSFAGDRRELIRSYPHMSAFQVKLTQLPITSYGDLQIIYQSVFPQENGSGGLAMLSLRFLDTKLCKGEQISDWMRRPLRLAQLHYASLDAYVEILIWDKLVSEAKSIGESVWERRVNLGEMRGIGEKASNAGVNLRCKKCGEEGHKDKECIKGLKCFLCHGGGHVAAGCPSVEVKS